MKVRSAVFSILFMFILASSVQAKVVINLGYASSPDSSYGVLASKFAELVNDYSKGDMVVKVRSNGQLGAEDEAFKALQFGTLDMHVITDSNISPHFGLMDAFALPYIFTNRANAYKVFDSPIGEEFKEKLRKETGVWLLSFGFIEYRDFYNSVRPIKTVADVKGLKIRVPKNEVMLGAWKAWGAAAMPIAWSETATALQTGVVKGGDNGTSMIKSQKFYELCKNFTVLEHFGNTTPIFASGKFMDSITQAQRDIILKAGKESALYQREEMGRREAITRKFLVEKGGMVLTEVDRSGFIRIAREFNKKYMADRSDEFKTFIDRVVSAQQ